MSPDLEVRAIEQILSHAHQFMDERPDRYPARPRTRTPWAQWLTEQTEGPAA